VGISAHFILTFRSLVTVAVSWPDFGVPSLHRKIPFPAGRAAAGLMPFGRPGMAVWELKTRFEASATIAGLCIQKFRSPRQGFDGYRGRAAWNFGSLERPKALVSNPVRDYCGFNPRASNCRLHSGGASRSRSTPMPRGKRPSTAARTRAGARKARDIVMLTCRTLHF
jgi:hypothetical protein